MGFLDKIKGVTNRLSGDWADLIVQVAAPVARGGMASVNVSVVVKEASISIDGVIVELRCEENVHIPNVTISGAGTTVTGSASATETIVNSEVRAAGPQELASGSTSTFAVEIPVSTEAPPSMTGRNARYEWKVRARLDMKGNDPDSGWENVLVT